MIDPSQDSIDYRSVSLSHSIINNFNSELGFQSHQSPKHQTTICLLKWLNLLHDYHPLIVFRHPYPDRGVSSLCLPHHPSFIPLLCFEKPSPPISLEMPSLTYLMHLCIAIVWIFNRAAHPQSIFVVMNRDELIIMSIM